jgi:ribose transport system substrate-binding protein
MRKLLLAAGLAVGLAAWAPGASAQTGTIPVIVKDTTSQFWQIVLAGARKAGQELGIQVPEMGAQSEADIAGQIAALENAVSTGPAAVVIAPTQFSALGPPITEAAERVKVIGIDSPADSEAFTSFLTTDNYKGGQIAADALAEAIKARHGAAEGGVALITALPGVGSLDARAKGFKDRLQEAYPELELVADKVADGQATTGLNIMSDLITANPELRGVFASNLYMAQGAGQALAETDASARIALVGFDSDDKLVQLLQDGVFSALIIQDPFRMGYEGVMTAHKAAQGEEVPADIDTGVNLITRENMDTARAKELLNPPT